MKNLYKNITLVFTSFLLVTQLFTVHAMEMFPKGTIKLQFSDQSDDEFTEVSKDLAMQFNTFSNMIEDAGELDVLIPVQGITSSMWIGIQNFLLPEPTHIRFMQPKSAMRLTMGLMSPSTRGIETMKGDLTGVEFEELENIVLAFNYLDPKKLTQAKQIFNNVIQEYEKRIIKVQFFDQDEGEFTQVNKDLMMKFNAISNMIEDIGEQNMPIPLNITKNTWSKIEQLLKPIPVFPLFKMAKAKLTQLDFDFVIQFSGNNDLKKIILALNYLDPKESTQEKMIFDNVKKEYRERLVKKGQITEDDFFNIRELDESIVNTIIQQVIEPSMSLKPSKPINHVASKPVNDLAFSPDGKTLAYALKNNTIKLWNITDLRYISKITTLTGHTSKIFNLAFSPDGKILASGSRDKTIKLWDVSDFQHISKQPIRTLENDSVLIFSLAFSPDGETFASTSSNILLWDFSDLPFTSSIKTLATRGWTYSIAFSPDGKILASADNGFYPENNAINLWDISDRKDIPKKPIATFVGHTEDVNSIVFSPDGKTLASGSKDKTIKLWDISDLKELPKKPIATFVGHTEHISGVAFRPDGKMLASGSKDKTIKLWAIFDLKDIPKKPIATFVGHTKRVNSIAFHPNGKTLASGSKDYTIKLWDILFVDALTLLNYLERATKNILFIQYFVILCNIIKDPSQRTEENYNKFPDNIRDIVKNLLPDDIEEVLKQLFP